MAKEKKQFRQLTDEELEKVTGGESTDKRPFISNRYRELPTRGECLKYMPDENGNCSQ